MNRVQPINRVQPMTGCQNMCRNSCSCGRTSLLMVFAIAIFSLLLGTQERDHPEAFFPLLLDVRVTEVMCFVFHTFTFRICKVQDVKFLMGSGEVYFHWLSSFSPFSVFSMCFMKKLPHLRF